MKMHFIGCKGVSMSVLMEIVKKSGIQVSGSDLMEGGHSATNIKDADVVVYTAAIGQDNVEFLEAKRKGIPLIERADLLGQISDSYDKIIAVAGSHGKTTTTAMIASILHKRNPTVHLGGLVKGVGNSRIGGKGFFITEACEYKRSFLKLEPTVCVILNTELDHTDYYQDKQDYDNAFFDFSKRAGLCVARYDCMNVVDSTKKIITFGNDMSDYFVKDVYTIEDDLPKTRFTVYEYGKSIDEYTINCFGLHNVQNALASIAVARVFRISEQDIKDGLYAFKGVSRRFEIVEKTSYGIIVNDYAHHPTEIIATIKAAKIVSKGKIRVIFQPHTFTRTMSLLNEFVYALSQADDVAMVPIYAAREGGYDVSSKDISNKIVGSIDYPNLNAAIEFLLQGQKDDINIIMGAGDIEKIIPIFLEYIKS